MSNASRSFVKQKRHGWAVALFALQLALAALCVVGMPATLAFADDAVDAVQEEEHAAAASETPAPAATPTPAPAPKPAPAPTPAPAPAVSAAPAAVSAPASSSSSSDQGVTLQAAGDEDGGNDAPPAGGSGSDSGSDSGSGSGSGTDDSGSDQGDAPAPGGGSGSDQGDDPATGGDSGSGSGSGSESGSGDQPAPNPDGSGSGDQGGAGDQGGSDSGNKEEEKKPEDYTTSEVPAGSAYVEEIGEGATFKNSKDANAINQAIAAALDEANSTGFNGKSVTVVIKDGTYEGNIVVRAEYEVEEDGKKVKKKFTVPEGFKIIFRSSGVLSAEGDKLAEGGIGVILKGGFDIADMSAELSGLFFSANNTIKVTGVDSFAFNGTSGNDVVTINLTDVSASTIVLGSGDDIVTVTYAKSDDKDKEGTHSLTAGKGDDVVSVTINTNGEKVSTYTVSGGEGNDTIEAKGAGGKGKNAVSVNGDAGDDTLVLDTSLHGSAYNTDTFKVDGGTGSDRVNLTGTIATHGLAGDKTALKVWDKGVTEANESCKAGTAEGLNLAFASVEAFTDELGGKEEIELEADTNGNILYTTPLKSFVNYVSKAGEIVSAIFTDATDAFLSTFKAAASKIYYIYAPVLNVLDQATEIFVGSNGDSAKATQALNAAKNAGVPEAKRKSLGIVARNVILKAYDDDKNFEFTIPGSEIVQSGGVTVDLSMFNFKCTGNVTIGSDAVIDASEFVALEAKSKQDHGMIPISQLNFVTVKIGNAEIDVKGTIKASAGVSMNTDSVVSITCSPDVLFSVVPNLPLAVAVGTMDNHIVLDGAVITTDGSVVMRAVNNITEASNASTGLLPVTIAVNVAVSYTDIQVKDSTINAGGMVSGTATSSVTQDARATLGKDPKYESGGFFAVNVSVHEANAIIDGNSTVTAGEDVRMTASATDQVSTRAVSGKIADTSAKAEKKESTKEMTTGTVTKLVKDVLMKVFDTELDKEGAAGNKIKGGFKSGVNSIDDSNESTTNNDGDTPSGDSGSGSESGSGSDSGSGSGDDQGDAPSPSSDTGKTVTKIFDTATSSTSDSSSSTPAEATGSETHVVGSVAVTVIVKSADAHVDSTGTITAGGDLVLNSIGNTMAFTISDASQITKSAAEKKSGKTVAGESKLTTKLENLKDLATSEDVAVTFTGGTYNPKNASIEIKGADGTTLVNVGGKVSTKDGKVIIQGGTTTISNVGVDMAVMNIGNITGEIKWTGDVEKGDKVQIDNTGKTVTTDGMSTVTYEDGSVIITGGEATLQGAKMNLEGASVILTDGAIYLKPAKEGEGLSVYTPDDKTSQVIGNFEIEQFKSGTIAITAPTGKVERNHNANVVAFEVVCDNESQITRQGGEETTDATGAITSSETTIEVGSDVEIKVPIDITAGENYGDLKMEGTKDADGNVITTTFIAAEEGKEGSEVSFTGDKMTLDNGSIHIADEVNYHITGGKKSTEGGIDTYKKAEDAKEMVIYIDGTFGFEVTTATYKGDVALDNVTWVSKAADAKPEDAGVTQTGNYILQDANTTISGANLKIENGRLVIKGENVELIDDNGVLTIKNGTVVFQLGKIRLTTTTSDIAVNGGKIKPTTKPSKSESTSLGVGVTVVVIDHDSTAYVTKKSTVKANGVKIAADSPLVSSDAQSHAGFSNSDTSIAGAITVQVNGIDTKAYVEDGAKVTLGTGELKVTANAKTSFSTVADCSAKTKDNAGDGDTTGVGAGLAIAVNGVDTIAKVGDGAVQAPEKVAAVTVTAKHSGKDKIKGKAGSAGGTSVTPALGLVVAGADVEAYLGSGDAIEAEGDVTVTANNKIEREVEANASAAGKDVAVGGAFGIVVLNDSAIARLKRSVKGSKVVVNSTGVQRTDNGVEAGAKGAPAEKKKGDSKESGTQSNGGGSSGESGSGDSEGDPAPAAKSVDQQADELINNAGNLGDLTGNNNISSENVSNLTSDRQKAETSEGPVSVAAGFALTVQLMDTRAEIGDGLNIESDGDVQVVSLNDQDSKVVANGSATNSKVGVGVAVALNINVNDNHAKLGDSTVKAGGDIVVSATQLDDLKPETQEDKELLDLFVEYMTKMGKNLAEHISEAYGLTGISEAIRGTLMDKLDAKLYNLSDELKGMRDDLAKAAVKALMNKQAEKFGAKIFDEDEETKGFPAEAGKIIGDVVRQSLDDLIDTSKIMSILKWDVSEIVKMSQKALNKSLTDIRNGFLGFLCKAFGTGDEAPESKYTTWAIAGAGASDVGVAGSVAIAVVNSDASATIASHNGAAIDNDITATGVTTVKTDTASTFDTVATAAVTDGGKPDKNENADDKADKTANDNASQEGSDQQQDGPNPSDSDKDKTVGVGAAFGMVYADLNSIAKVGENRNIVTGGLSVTADAANKAETFSVAGTDPLADNSDGDPKDVAVDASIALNIINASTEAVYDKGSVIKTSGVTTITEAEGDKPATEEFTDNPIKRGDKEYGVVVAANTEGSTLSKASGFATGNSTAVGAAVAVNIALTDTNAQFKGEGSSTGNVLVDATEKNEDNSLAVATAVGPDMNRLFKKFSSGISTISEWANKLASGEVKLKDPSKKKGDNKTADKINDTLNQNKVSNEHADGTTTKPEDQEAAPGASLSTNLLSILDLKSEEKAPIEEAMEVVTGNTNKTESPVDAPAADPASSSTDSNDDSKEIMVAAAISVNITKHHAESEFAGNLSAAAFDVLSNNFANYRANGTGAAMTGGKATASVGAAVAVGVNLNKSLAKLSGTANVIDAKVTDADWKDKAAKAGAVNVIATHTQNMDGVYAGLLGAQSLAGATSGDGSTATVAGAISVLVGNADTEAIVAPKSTITGGDVTVKAYDKSKYATRAGALMASGGSTVGVGASFALIYGSDTVRARIEDGATILANSLDVTAEKAIVTFSDYGVGKDLSCVYQINPSTKKSDLDPEAIDAAHDSPLISVTPVVDGDKTTYQIDLSVDTDAVLNAIDLLNFLSSTNYYVEAIGGALSAPWGDSDVSVAGSFAFAFSRNTIDAYIGKGSTINLADDLNVAAIAGNNVRMISGAFSVGNAEIGVGASLAVFSDKGSATSKVDSASDAVTTINADGSVTVTAHGSQTDPSFTGAESEEKAPYQSSNVLVIAVAPGISTGSIGVGAVLPVIVMENSYEAEVADNAVVTAKDDIAITAQNDADLLPISLSAAYAENAAVGGTVQVIVEKTVTTATVGKNAKLTSTEGGARVTADSYEFMVDVLASVSVSKQLGVAGVINVVVTRSDTEAFVDEGTIIKAKKDAEVSAHSESFMVAVTAAVSGSTGGSSGSGIVNVFVFDRDVLAQVAKGAQIISEDGDTIISSTAEDYTVIVAAGGSFASEAAVSGTIPVVVSLNDVKALIGSYEKGADGEERLEAAGNELKAKGTIGVIADYDTKQYVAAGGFSGGSNAVGATILTTVVNNDVHALVGYGANMTAGGSGAGITVPKQDEKRKGVVVSATSDETFLAAAVSGAAGSANAVTGVINTAVFSNSVHGIIYGGGTIKANADDAEGDLGTFASSTSNLYVVSGSLSAAGNVGVGATVTTFTYEKDVIASANAYEPGTIEARNVEVKAGNTKIINCDKEEEKDQTSDRLYLFAVSISGSGTVAVGAGASVLYFDNSNIAELGGTVKATGDVDVRAENDSHLINAAAAVAGSGTASVTGEVAVTYFRNKNIARVIGGSDVTAGGDMTVKADSTERVDADMLGITGSGAAAVSGTVGVIVTTVTTKAIVGNEANAESNPTTNIKANSLEVKADDDFDLLSIAGTAAVAGTAGVGITAVVAKSNNDVEAYLGRNTNVTCPEDITIDADADRDVQMYLATISGGGAVGVGVTVLVSVVGGNIDQDSADAIANNKKDKNGQPVKEVFYNPIDFKGKMVKTIDEGVGKDTLAGGALVDKINGTDFEADIQGDGQHHTNDDINAGEFDVDGDEPVSDDVKAASDLGKTATSTEPDTSEVPEVKGDDIARAYVATGSTVSGKNITINANSHLNLDLMALTASGAGVAAVSPSVVVGLTHANAAAYTDTATTLTATGDIKVTSWTGSTTVNAPEGSDEATRNAGVKDKIRNASDAADFESIGKIFDGRSVRAIAVSGSGGFVGVSPVVAYLGLDSNSYAYIAGDVTKANDLTVKAETHFPVAASATLGIAAGAVGVSASSANVVSNGVVYSGIVGLANIENVAGKVSVLSDTDFDATTFAAGIAGGGVAVNGAVAVSADHMRVDTFVGKAVKMNNVGDVVIAADADVTSHANVIGGAVGAIAVNAGIAVATIEPTIVTYMGSTPLVNGKIDHATVGADGTNNAANVKSLTIDNDITTRGQALTIGAAVGAISAGTNVLVVSNDTLARSGINQKDVNVAEATVIDNDFSAIADSELYSVSAGLAALGVNVFVSDLTADARAIVDTTDASVSTGSLEVYAGHKDNPNVSAATADGIGASAGIVAANVNVAVADNETVNNAEVTGTGDLAITGGTLVVEANGTADARATMNPGMVVAAASIAANNAFAYLDATQEAKIEKAVVNTNGGDVKIISRFNLEEGDTHHGANSKLGANGAADKNIEVTLVGVNTSVGRARMDSTVRAIANDVTLNTGNGSVDVLVDARSYANSDIISPEVSISLGGAGVIDNRTEAKGTFEAILGMAGDSNTGTVNIANNYSSDAYAGTGPTGGFKGSLVSADVNVARADTNTTAKAGLAGNGTLNVNGDVKVATTGTANAETEGRTYKFSVSGFSVAVNDIASTQDVTQEAYSTFGGKLTATGDFAVTSTLGDAANPATAKATVGSSAGASVGLGSVKVNYAKTETTSTNSAYVTGLGNANTVYDVKSATVKATTDGKSIADAQTCLSVSLASNGSLDARSYSTDNVSSKLDALSLKAKGNVAVDSASNTVVNATVITAGAISGSNVSSLRAYTEMGKEDARQTVTAGIGEKTNITAGGDVVVDANNNGSTQGKIDGGKNKALDDEIDARFNSKSYFQTDATVGNGSNITAEGDIKVNSSAMPNLWSDARASSLGIVTSAVTTYADTTSQTTSNTTVGSDVTMEAGKGVAIASNGSIYQDSVTASDASGFVGEDAIKSYLTLDREVNTTVGSGTTIKADFGNIAISSTVGTDDYISNVSRAEAGGFAGYSNVRTDTDVTSKANTIIADGVVIEDTFGKVDITSDSSMKYFYNEAYCDAKGVGAEPDAKSDTDLTLESNVVVGSDAGETAYIMGRNVNLDSLNSTMKVIDYTYAHGAALGANVDAYSDVNFKMNDTTKVRKTEIRGYDTVKVASTSAPEVSKGNKSSDNQNILVSSYASISAIGDADAKAYFNSESVVKNTVDMDSSVVYGADIDVVSDTNLKYKPKADGYKSSFFASLDKYTRKPSEANSTPKTSIGNTEFYVGDAVAGIKIDISGTDANPYVRAVGIRGERKVWDITPGADGSIKFSKINNPQKGTLDVVTSKAGQKTYVAVSDKNVYDQSVLSDITINNHTNLDVVLNAITIENDNYLNPTVNGKSTNVQDSRDVLTPTVNIVNEGNGDVTVSGLIANTTGSVNFTWTNAENNGSLKVAEEELPIANLDNKVAPIWAHDLKVDGAATVGAEDKRVSIYATWKGDEAPTTFVHADGDIWFAITDVKFDEGEPKADATPRETGVVSDIAGNANTDVLIHTAMTIYRDDNSAIITMPIPGTAEFTTGKIGNLSASVELDENAMSAYLVDEDDNGRSYLLPNGTVIYADLDGTVTRIIEGGIDVTLSDYNVVKNENGDLIASLGEGVHFNLADGTISVDDGASLEMALSSIDGEWLLDKLLNGGRIIVRDYNKTTEETITRQAMNEDGTPKVDDEGNPVYETIKTTVPTEVELSVTALFETTAADGGANYYYQLTGVDGYSVDDAFEGIASRGNVYIISYSTNGNSLGVFNISDAVEDEVIYSESGVEPFEDFLGLGLSIGPKLESIDNQIVITGWALVLYDEKGETIAAIDLTAVKQSSDGYWYVDSQLAEASSEAETEAVEAAYKALEYAIWTSKINLSADPNDAKPVSISTKGVTANPADAVLTQDEQGNYELLLTARDEINYTESSVVLLGTIEGVIVDTIELPEDTNWKDANAAKTGYKIDDSLYVATDGIYYFRKPNDPSGFESWFNTMVDGYDFTTAEMPAVDFARLVTTITYSLLDDPQAYEKATLTEKLYAINLSLLRDDANDPLTVLLNKYVALERLNDAAGYAQWLVNQIANTKPKYSEHVLELLDAMTIDDKASNYVTAGHSEQAWYDSTTDNHKLSTALMAVETPVVDDEEQVSTITLKAGQSIYLEVLSPDVARSVDGTYYAIITDASGAESYKAATEGTHKSGSEDKTLEDGTELKTATETFDISYNGECKLTIKNFYDATTGKLVFVEYTMVDGTVADSDGNVTTTDAAWTATKDSGSTYPVSMVSGKATKVTLEDTGEGAALVNGNPTPAIVGDDITIVTGKGVEIGKDGDMLVTAAYTEGTEANVKFETLEDGEENVITGNVWLETEGSVKLPDNLIITEGSSYHHEATEDIIYTTIDVEKSAKAELIAGRDIIGVSRDNGDEGYLKVAEDATATLTAHRDNIFQNVIADENSTIDLEAVKSDDYPTTSIVGGVIDAEKNAKVTLNTDGNINSADNYMVADMAEGTPLYIEHANDYYILAESSDVKGLDKDGNEYDGTGITDLGNETIATDVVKGSTADVAKWIMDRIAGNDEVIAKLNDAAADPVDEYIANGDAEGFAAWMQRQLDQGTLDNDAIKALVDSLIADDDVAPVMAADLAAAVLADTENLKSWITARLSEDDPRLAELDTMDETELATLVESLVTEDEVTAANEAARADYIDTLMANEDGNLAQWLVDHLKGNADAINALDGAVAEKVDDIIASGDAQALAAWIDRQAEQGQVDKATLADVISDLITPDDLAAMQKDAHSKATYPAGTEDAVDTLRDFEIKVGESTGSAYVENLGDIKVSQETGNMTVGKIDSVYGEVTLVTTDAEAGDIIANADEDLNIHGTNVTITATGDAGASDGALVIETGTTDSAVIGCFENEKSGATPKVVYDEETGAFKTDWNVDYHDAAKYNEAETGSLTIDAADNVNVAEKTGDLGLNTIKAEGDVEVAGANVTDVRAADETKPNIDAHGATMVATEGNVGTAAKPITVDTTDGTVNAAAPKDVNITEVAGDMKAGAIVAGGTATISVPDGKLTDADASDKAAKIAELLEKARVDEAEAASAAESARLRQDSLKKLEEAFEAAQKAADDAQSKADDDLLAADNAQASADRALDNAMAAQATADASADAAKDAQDAADAAQKRADDLKAAEQALAEATESGDAEAIQAAQDALDQAKQQIADALNIDPSDVTDELADATAAEAKAQADQAKANADADQATADEAARVATAAQNEADAAKKAAEASQKAADAAQAKADAASTPYQALKDEVEGYKKTADDKKAEAEAARAEAEALKNEEAKPAITTGGDLNVKADALGTDDNALSTNVGGKLNATANDGTFDSVNIENEGNLTTNGIKADGDVTMSATGNIQVSGDGKTADITTGKDAKTTLRSAGGDVGTKSNPISVETGSVDAYGNNVYVEGHPDVNVDSVVAENEAVINAPGNVTDTKDGNGVVADNATINAGGTIGTTDNPLDVDADKVNTTSGGNTDVNLTNPETNVNIDSDGNANIDSTGAVNGKVEGENVNINADGNIGTTTNPVNAKVNGGTKAKATGTSKYGTVNMNTTNSATTPAAKGTNKIVAKVKAEKTGKKGIVRWNKITGAERYVVYLSRTAKGKLKKYKTVSAKKRKVIIKGLKRNGYYRVRVFAQKKVGGKWKNITKSRPCYFVTKKNTKKSNPVKLTLNKTKLTLKRGKTFKIKGKIKLFAPKKKMLKYVKRLRFLSTDTKIATVSKSGKITAKSKGTILVWVQCVNGYWKKVKVTVK